jgi:hypothetical protein
MPARLIVFLIIGTMANAGYGNWDSYYRLKHSFPYQDDTNNLYLPDVSDTVAVKRALKQMTSELASIAQGAKLSESHTILNEAYFCLTNLSQLYLCDYRKYSQSLNEAFLDSFKLCADSTRQALMPAYRLIADSYKKAQIAKGISPADAEQLTALYWTDGSNDTAVARTSLQQYRDLIARGVITPQVMRNYARYLVLLKDFKNVPSSFSQFKPAIIKLNQIDRLVSDYHYYLLKSLKMTDGNIKAPATDFMKLINAKQCSDKYICGEIIKNTESFVDIPVHPDLLQATCQLVVKNNLSVNDLREIGLAKELIEKLSQNQKNGCK